MLHIEAHRARLLQEYTEEMAEDVCQDLRQWLEQQLGVSGGKKFQFGHDSSFVESVVLPGCMFLVLLVRWLTCELCRSAQCLKPAFPVPFFATTFPRSHASISKTGSRFMFDPIDPHHHEVVSSKQGFLEGHPWSTLFVRRLFNPIQHAFSNHCFRGDDKETPMFYYIESSVWFITSQSRSLGRFG